MAATVDLFDTNVQKEVPFTLSVDDNGEIVAKSTESERFLKFPAGLTKAQFEKEMKVHNDTAAEQEVISEDELKERDAKLKKSKSLLEFYE